MTNVDRRAALRRAASAALRERDNQTRIGCFVAGTKCDPAFIEREYLAAGRELAAINCLDAPEFIPTGGQRAPRFGATPAIDLLQRA